MASASKQSIDFTNVKEGGSFSKKHMPAGDYLARVTKVEDAMPKDKSDKTPMWLFTIQLKETPSATYPYYCKLQENQLWKVRNLLVAAGINVPKKKVAVDPNKLIGKLVAVSLDDTEYNDKMQSEVAAVFSPNELDGDTGVDDEDEDDVEEPDDDDEEETPAPKKKKAKAPEPEEEDDDEEEEEEEPAPVKKKKKKVAEPEPEEDEEEDDEDEEPEPPKKKRKSKKERAAAKAAAAAAADDDEDDDEIDIEDLD